VRFTSLTRSLGMGLVLASLGAMAGCSETVLISNPDTAPPTRVDAVIEVTSDNPDNPLLVDFGEVNAGESRDKEITVKNIGTDTLQLQDFVLSNLASFELLNIDDLVPLLVPEASWVLQVRYSPAQDETVQATLIVASNDRENPEVPVSLRAEGLAPAIDIDPDSFDFGNRELGCVGSLNIQISNVGRAPLQLDDIVFEDLSGNGEMTVQHSIALGAGNELEPGTSVTAEIFYAPSDVQPDTGTLTVVSNDPLRPEASATQFGIAHLGESNVDQFAQDGNNSTDILWVVDNSCSMGEEQSSLAVNFASFVQIVEALDMDYQIAVTTTDVGDNGSLEGTTPIVTPNTPDPAGTFAANVNLGVSGSGIEKGFDGSYLALSGTNIGPGGPNAPFLRTDAGLRIIYISDEQEQSTLLPTTQDYVSYFEGLKANPEHVVLSDITGGLTGCSGGGGNAGAGTDYVQATVLTGGISASICDPNWVSTLSALAWLAQSFADTFELSETPVPETIEVRLSTDGINFVPIYVGWVFDQALNAIVFDLDHIPDNGDVIEVEYTVLGDCED